MTYSRQHPSPRYVAMMDQYKSLHTGGSEQRQMSAQETYPGISLFPHIHWSIVVQSVVARPEGRAMVEEEVSGGALHC